MALTANGAKGRTLDELSLVLGGAPLDTVNGGLNALARHVEAVAGDVDKADGTRTRLDLDAANGLFGQRGTGWKESFLEPLAAEYGAGVHVVDWAGDTAAARDAVNAWTAEQTRDEITEILPPGAVDASVRLVLVNTLYLKAPWERPFETTLTEDAPFTLLDGSTATVASMRSGEPVGDAFAAGDGWSAVRLPYAGGAVAMTVVVPDEGRFADVEDVVAERGLAPYLDEFAPDDVLVTLPSWTFRFHASLVEPLKAMGVEVPFTVGADLTGMTDDERLMIHGVEHEVFIAVDEEGTEAAAATAVVVGTTSAPSYAELVVDRPFFFQIHDVAHGTPLFLGRVVDPTVG